MSISGTALPKQPSTWAASVVLKDLTHGEIRTKYSSDRRGALETLSSRLQTCGLKVLTVRELKQLWREIERKPFVVNNGLGYTIHISTSAKKAAWVEHVGQFLRLPQASGHLIPVIDIDQSEETPAAATGAVAPRAAAAAAAAATVPSRSAVPPVHPRAATVSTGTSPPARQGISPAHSVRPHIADRTHGPTSANPQLYQLQQNQQRFRDEMEQMFGQRPGQPMSYQHQQSYPAGQIAAALGIAHTSHVAVAAMPSAHVQQLSGTSPSRKRNAFSMENGIGNNNSQFSVGSLAAGVMNGSGGGDDGSDGPRTPLEERLWSDLQMMGFPDKKECIDAIRHMVERSSGEPTSDAVMMYIIEQREGVTAQQLEFEDARILDQVRILSEQQTQEDDERLQNDRTKTEENRLLDASYTDLIEPSDKNNKIMFPCSWLLRYEKTKPMMKDIINDRANTETKKSLFRLLKSEKNACKWYNGDIAKAYFACVVGNRLLDASCDKNAMVQEIEAIVSICNQAMALPSEQNEDGIPNIFIDAKNEYGSTCRIESESSDSSKKENVDDDDDSVEMLTDDQVREMKKSSDDRKPAATVSLL